METKDPTVLPTVPALPTDFDGWVAALNQCDDEAVAAAAQLVAKVVAYGQMLLAAKKALPHGEWMRLFEGNRLRRSLGTCERLMKIARNVVLSNSAHGPNLPTSWRTLYELTMVPEPLLIAGAGILGIVLKQAG